MPQWLVDVVGESLAPIAWVAIAAIIVILLAMLMIFLARKAFGGSMGSRVKGRAPRLAVMDITSIDQKRRLVLVRRDEVEHLILVGGQNDVLIEGSILRIPAAARSRSEPSFRNAEETEPDENAILDRIMTPRTDNPVAAPPQPAVPPRQPRPAAAAGSRNPVQRPNGEARPAAAAHPSQPAPAAAAPRQEAAPRPASPSVAPPVAVPAPNLAPAVVAPAATAAVPSATARPVAPPPARIDPGASPQRREAPAGAPAQAQRRPSPQTPPAQPRSMATPTLPPRSPADTAPEAGPAGNGVDLSKRADGRPSGAAAGAPGPDIKAERAPGRSGDREPSAASLPMEGPDRIALRSRMNTAQSMNIGKVGDASAPAPASQAAPAGERPAEGPRQASLVRSFASVIQSRQGPAEMPAPAMPLRQAARPAAAQPPVPEASTHRGEVRVEPSLEDFLTAELSAGFDEESEKPARTPGSESPASRTAPAAPSPKMAPPPTAAPAPKRPLTLEEEMERLLGDFTLDISDRRTK